jgi:hypothetical protein
MRRFHLISVCACCCACYWHGCVCYCLLLPVSACQCLLLPVCLRIVLLLSMPLLPTTAWQCQLLPDSASYFPDCAMCACYRQNFHNFVCWIAEYRLADWHIWKASGIAFSGLEKNILLSYHLQVAHQKLSPDRPQDRKQRPFTLPPQHFNINLFHPPHQPPLHVR